MKRNVWLLLWSVALISLQISCTTEEYDFGTDGDETVDGETGGGTVTTPTITGESGDLLDYTIAFDTSDESTYGAMTETVSSSDEDFIENSSFGSTVTITYSGTSASVENGAGVTVSTSGAHVTVTSSVSGVKYVLSGSTTNGSFKVYSDYKFEISLAGVSITNPSGAAINVQSSKRVFVVSEAGTTNVLTDGSSYTTTDGEDMKACLFSEGQLIFSGSGSLTVTGNYKHGITSDEYVRFRSGCNVTVAAAAKDGIHTNDAVIMGGGVVNITSSDDGVQCEEGGITMTGGFLKITTTADKGHGLNSYSDVVISGGALQVSTSGYGAKGISSDGAVTVSGGKITAITTGGSYYDSSTRELSSAAGIKCDGNMTLSGGVIGLRSSGGGGKGINCDGTLVVNCDTLKVITTGTRATATSGDTTSPKGIKSDGALTINGGVVLVKATGGEGSEGIESKSTLIINDGTVVAYCYDDGINSASALTINGGSVYSYGSSNDGIDSNSTLTINGGIVVAVGTTSPEEGLDSEGTFRINGGVVIGIGGSAMTTPATSSSQRVIMYNGTGTSGQLLNIQSSSGTSLVTYEAPRTYSAMTFLYSGPNLTSGLSCVLYKGGSVSGGTDFFGYYYDDYTYSNGTQTSTFTLSSVITTVGTSTSMGGGGTTPGGTGGGTMPGGSTGGRW